MSMLTWKSQDLTTRERAQVYWQQMPMETWQQQSVRRKEPYGSKILKTQSCSIKTEDYLVIPLN